MNTDTARAAILARIRGRQGRVGASHAVEAPDAD
jgi:hypothetical protein